MWQEWICLSPGIFLSYNNHSANSREKIFTHESGKRRAVWHDISKDGSHFLIFGCAKKKNEVNYRYAEKECKKFRPGRDIQGKEEQTWQKRQILVGEKREEIKYRERKRLLFFGLPWTFTKYTISRDMITVDEGLIKVEENDCYMYKVQDVKLTATLPERIFGLGNDHLLHGDVTDKELRTSHIKHAKEIKNYLLKASEAARIKETHIKHAGHRCRHCR